MIAFVKRHQVLNQAVVKNVNVRHGGMILAALEAKAAVNGLHHLLGVGINADAPDIQAILQRRLQENPLQLALIVVQMDPRVLGMHPVIHDVIEDLAGENDAVEVVDVLLQVVHRGLNLAHVMNFNGLGPQVREAVLDHALDPFDVVNMSHYADGFHRHTPCLLRNCLVHFMSLRD